MGERREMKAAGAEMASDDEASKARRQCALDP
jgi:hypothetical protein